MARWLGPDGALAVIAIGLLAGVAAALGGRLQIPWDGIVPFVVVGCGLLAISVAIALVDLAAGRGRGRFVARQLRALRLFAPFAVVYLAYRALRGALPFLVDANGIANEARLRAADESLLGASPAWSLEAVHAPWLTELLAYAYATMFFLPLALLLVLHVRGRDRELRTVACALQIAFYLGFLGFLVFPARSPDIVYVFDHELVGHGFYELSSRAWRSLQAVTYDAFPSMHTAISTLAVIYAWRLRDVLAPRRPLVPVLVIAPIVVLLQLATLYLRQHYFVDLIAGWLVAIVAIAIAGRMIVRERASRPRGSPWPRACDSPPAPTPASAVRRAPRP